VFFLLLLLPHSKAHIEMTTNTKKAKYAGTHAHASKAQFPSTFTYSPAEKGLQLYFDSTIALKNGDLTQHDLEALEVEFAKTVVPNKPPRPVHKNPSVFAMEGCPYHMPQAALTLMEKIQGPRPSVYLSTPCLNTDSFGG
jgi:hypothetical protein